MWAIVRSGESSFPLLSHIGPPTNVVRAPKCLDVAQLRVLCVPRHESAQGGVMSRNSPRVALQEKPGGRRPMDSASGQPSPETWITQLRMHPNNRRPTDGADTYVGCRSRAH
jgi:hypothetical protein